MSRPYRDTEAIAKRDVPDTLECWLRDGDKNRWVRSLYVKVWITISVCGSIAISSARIMSQKPAHSPAVSSDDPQPPPREMATRLTR